MIDTSKTLTEELESQGIVGSYIWNPNRFFAKTPTGYVSVDVVTDGAAAEVIDEIEEFGSEKKAEIENLAAEKISFLRKNEKDYEAFKTNLLQTYQRLYLYFNRVGMPQLATVMATAIANINNL